MEEITHILTPTTRGNGGVNPEQLALILAAALIGPPEPELNAKAMNTPFTPENAREMQRRSVMARHRNKLAVQVAPAEPEAHAAIKVQIARVLAKMESTRSNKEIARLSLVLERLWNMVFPKAGARKPRREDHRKPLPQALHATDAWESLSNESPSPVTESMKQICSPSTPDLTKAPAIQSAPPGPAAAAPVMPVVAPLQTPVQPATGDQSNSALSSLPNRPLPDNNQMGELKSALCNLFRRPTALAWPDAETSLLAEIAQRSGALQEFQLLVNYRRRLPMDKREFFPNSVARLLEKWNETLDRARRSGGAF